MVSVQPRPSKPAASIAVLHADQVGAEFAFSLLAMVEHSREQIGTVLHVRSGPNLASKRNEITAQYLMTRPEPWLLMIDTDMVMAPTALQRLLGVAHRQTHPIVGGLCFAQQGPDGAPEPTMYELVPHADGAGTFARYTTWPEDDLLEVGATGAAFLLVHRYVFERIARGWAPGKVDRVWPWFRETTMGSRAMGEDMTFCLRARSAGYKIWVHTGVQLGHMKPTMLGKVS